MTVAGPDLSFDPRGLSSSEAAVRLARNGPNSLRTHRVSAWAVLRRQLNNAVLALLAITAVVSFFLGGPPGCRTGPAGMHTGSDAGRPASATAAGWGFRVRHRR